MRDPIQQPDADDPAIEHATDEVMKTWQEATPGKDPSADADDFARMRDGVAEITRGDGVDPAADEGDAR